MGPFLQDLAGHFSCDLVGALNFAIYQPTINTMELASISNYILGGMSTEKHAQRVLSAVVCALCEGSTLWWGTSPQLTAHRLSLALSLCKWVKKQKRNMHFRHLMSLILAARSLLRVPTTDKELDEESIARMSSYVRGKLPASVDWSMWDDEVDEGEAEMLWTEEVALWMRGELGDVDISVMTQKGTHHTTLGELWKASKQARHDEKYPPKTEDPLSPRSPVMRAPEEPGAMPGQELGGERAQLAAVLLGKPPSQKKGGGAFARGYTTAGIWNLWKAVRDDTRVTANSVGNMLRMLPASQSGFLHSIMVCDGIGPNLTGGYLRTRVPAEKQEINMMGVAMGVAVLRSPKLQAPEMKDIRDALVDVCAPMLRGLADSNPYGARLAWTLAVFLFGSLHDAERYATKEWDDAFQEVDTVSAEFWHCLRPALQECSTDALYAPIFADDSAIAPERTKELLSRWMKRMNSSDGGRSHLKTLIASVEEGARMKKKRMRQTLASLMDTHDVWRLLPTVPYLDVEKGLEHLTKTSVPSVQMRRTMVWVAATWAGWCWYAVHALCTTSMFINPYTEERSEVEEGSGGGGSGSEGEVDGEASEGEEGSSADEAEDSSEGEEDIWMPGGQRCMLAGASAYDMGWSHTNLVVEKEDEKGKEEDGPVRTGKKRKVASSKE